MAQSQILATKTELVSILDRDYRYKHMTCMHVSLANFSTLLAFQLLDLIDYMSPDDITRKKYISLIENHDKRPVKLHIMLLQHNT